MNKKKALLRIVNSRKDLNFQQEDIWTIIDQMEEWTVIAIQNRLHKFWPILNKKMDHFYVFLSCILFPIQPKYGFGAAKLIKTPYMNWRKATDYLFSHADECEDHKMSYNRLDAFLNTQNNPSFRIYQEMPNSACEMVESNRRFLKFILRVLQYLGRQGLALQGRRDDRAALRDDAINKGNFKVLLDVMSHTDQHLQNHLETCSRNSTYISKTT